MSSAVMLDGATLASVRNCAGFHAEPGLWSPNGSFVCPLMQGAVVALPPAKRKITRAMHYMASPPPKADRQLWRGQVKVMELAEPHIAAAEHGNSYFQICMCTGGGKTFVTRVILERLRLRTVVVLDTKLLFEQWAQALEGMDVHKSTVGPSSLLASDKVHDVLICCRKHFDNPDFVQYFEKNYSVLVIDESHLYNLLDNNNMGRFLALNSPPVVISLSATPHKRNDLYLGERCVHKEDRQFTHKLFTVRPGWEPSTEVGPVWDYVWHNNRIGKRFIKGEDLKPEFKYGLFRNVFAKDSALIEVFAAGLQLSLQKGERVIAVSSSRTQIDELYNYLLPRVTPGVLFNDSELVRCKEATGSFVLLTTTKKGGQGLDVSNANSLHVVSVESNESTVTQVLGRVQRPGDCMIRSVYIYDACGLKAPPEHPISKLFDELCPWRKRKFTEMKIRFMREGSWCEHSIVVERSCQ